MLLDNTTFMYYAVASSGIGSDRLDQGVTTMDSEKLEEYTSLVKLFQMIVNSGVINIEKYKRLKDISRRQEALRVELVNQKIGGRDEM